MSHVKIILIWYNGRIHRDERKEMSTTMQDDKLLETLAGAFARHPGGTLKEIAEEIGISRATLHRVGGAKDNLLKLLDDYSGQVMSRICLQMDPHLPPKLGLRQLIQEHLAYRNVILYQMTRFQEACMSNVGYKPEWQQYEATLDAFFLRGQEQRVFRLDLSAKALTEMLSSLIYGTVEAERRGRIASVDSGRNIETLFLEGAQYSPSASTQL